MADLPIWNRAEHPPLINHRNEAQVAANPSFTRISLVDVPTSVQDLDRAIELYTSEVIPLLDHGIRVIDQTRVLVRAEDIAADNLLGLAAVKNQPYIHGGSLLPDNCFLGSVVSRVQIDFGVEGGDAVPDALHAYTYEALGSDDRRYMIGDLNGYQVTRAESAIGSTEEVIGMLFDTDLVIKKAQLF